MADDTGSGNAGLDPRFDPAFQRGFEGTIGTTRRRAPVGTPSVVPAQDIVQKSVVVEPSQRAVIAEPPETLPATRGPEPREDVEAPRFSPFVAVLVVIAVALIGAGIWGAIFANSVFQTDLTSSVSYVTVLLVISGSAVSIGVGVATLIGIVFLYAARSLRR